MQEQLRQDASLKNALDSPQNSDQECTCLEVRQQQNSKRDELRRDCQCSHRLRGDSEGWSTHQNILDARHRAARGSPDGVSHPGVQGLF